MTRVGPSRSNDDGEPLSGEGCERDRGSGNCPGVGGARRSDIVVFLDNVGCLTNFAF